MVPMGSQGIGQACASGLPNPGRDEEGQRHPDTVMSGVGDVLVCIGRPLISSQCLTLGPPYPMFKTPPQVHIAQHSTPQELLLRVAQPAARASKLPLSSIATPLGRREQIAEPCYLQAFKWLIES